ncbi:MAG: LacI family DNA-binding transcriptional regulator, partial [Victivallaceae bacterium]
MAVTLKDIAERAGVSRAAVSLALNNSETRHVSSDKKIRILHAVKELGYRPNYSARRLRGGSTRTVGIIGGLFGVPVHAAITDAIMHQLWKCGYQVLLGDVQHYPGQSKDIVGEFESRGVDAFVITSGISEERKVEIPVPFIGVTHNQTTYDIATDMAYGGYIAGRHLIKHGHKKIAYITSKMNSCCGRLTGLQKALEEAGLTLSNDFIIENTVADSIKAVLALVKGKGVTAFFCMNDFIAGRLIFILKQSGFNIPGDIAVIGFDGLPFAQFTSPSLTTVVQPVRKLAEQTVALLLRKINGDENPQTESPLLIKPVLRLGNSCGCEEQSLNSIYPEWEMSTLDYTYQNINEE